MAIYLKKIIFSLLLLFALPTLTFAQPARIPSFGPNGTHWPSLIPTPFMYDPTVPNIIHVPASWDAIKTALTNVTTAQVSAGTLILVAPGNLVGLGKSSSSNPVIQNLGSKTWTKRVTVAPRDGYGTVTWTGPGTRIDKVYGVAFAGFKVENSVRFVGNTNSALAWMKIDGGQMGIYGTSGSMTSHVEFVEIVRGDHQVVSDDNTDVYGGGGGIENVHIVGSYFTPRWFEYPYTGGKPHTDTLQFAAGSGGTYNNMVIKDTALFSSNNCAIQTGAIDNLLVENSLVVSGAPSLSRYPHLNGGATEATSNAFNGSGKNLRALNSIFIGGMGLNQSTANNPWSSAINTLTSKTYGGYNQPISGSWTVKTELEEVRFGNANPATQYSATAAKAITPIETFTVDGKTYRATKPTDAYLASIWRKPGTAIKTPNAPTNLRISAS